MVAPRLFSQFPDWRVPRLASSRVFDLLCWLTCFLGATLLVKLYNDVFTVCSWKHPPRQPVLGLASSQTGEFPEWQIPGIVSYTNLRGGGLASSRTAESQIPDCRVSNPGLASSRTGELHELARRRVGEFPERRISNLRLASSRIGEFPD